MTTYTEYIQAPLQNLLLWLVSLTPGMSLAMGLLLLALLTKMALFVFIYHGHVTSLKIHHIRKHRDKISEIHKSDHNRLKDEIHDLYNHYKFNPWHALVISFLQFIILLGILNFLYAGSKTGFYDLSLTTMENIFIPTVMNLGFAGISLVQPLSSIWALIVLGIVQFLSLELYLLSKRKLHKVATYEEKIEHIMNIILTFAVLYVAHNLPAAMGLYWFFYLLLGVLRKIFFDIYIDKKIIKKLFETEKKFIKKEKKNILKFDQGLIYWIWKMFHPKAHEKTYHALREKIRKEFFALHHNTHIYHAHTKIVEEPHVAAFLILFL